MERFTASIKISPLKILYILHKADINELFPAPVLPMTPIFSEGTVSNETPFRDIGPSCLKYMYHKVLQNSLLYFIIYLYFRNTFENCIIPLIGQAKGVETVSVNSSKSASFSIFSI